MDTGQVHVISCNFDLWMVGDVYWTHVIFQFRGKCAEPTHIPVFVSWCSPNINCRCGINMNQIVNEVISTNRDRLHQANINPHFWILLVVILKSILFFGAGETLLLWVYPIHVTYINYITVFCQLSLLPCNEKVTPVVIWGFPKS